MYYGRQQPGTVKPPYSPYACNSEPGQVLAACTLNGESSKRPLNVQQTTVVVKARWILMFNVYMYFHCLGKFYT